MRFRSALALSLMAGGVLAVAVPSASFAASNANALPVTAQVVATASVSADPLAFGSYTGALLDSTSLITVTATIGTSYSIGLGYGNNSTGGTQRFLQSTNRATLPYQLFQNSTRTTVWGNSDGNSVVGSGMGSAQQITVYGRIPAGQSNASVGTYTDTVTATVTY